MNLEVFFFNITVECLLFKMEVFSGSYSNVLGRDVTPQDLVHNYDETKDS